MVNLYQLTTFLFVLVVAFSSNLPEPKDFKIVKAEKQITLNSFYPTEITKI